MLLKININNRDIGFIMLLKRCLSKSEYPAAAAGINTILIQIAGWTSILLKNFLPPSGG